MLEFICAILDEDENWELHHVNPTTDLKFDTPHVCLMHSYTLPSNDPEIEFQLCIIFPLEFDYTPLDEQIAESMLYSYVETLTH